MLLTFSILYDSWEAILASWTALGVALGLHLRVDGVTMAILGDILGGFGAILDASWTILGGWEAKKHCFSFGFLRFFAIPFWADLISFWVDFEIELGS